MKITSMNLYNIRRDDHGYEFDVQYYTDHDLVALREGERAPERREVREDAAPQEVRGPQRGDQLPGGDRPVHEHEPRPGVVRQGRELLRRRAPGRDRQSILTEREKIMLVKFFEKREYAEDFVNGRLYLNPVSHFRGHDDSGRWDANEGLLPTPIVSVEIDGIKFLVDMSSQLPRFSFMGIGKRKSAVPLESEFGRWKHRSGQIRRMFREAHCDW